MWKRGDPRPMSKALTLVEVGRIKEVVCRHGLVLVACKVRLNHLFPREAQGTQLHR